MKNLFAVIILSLSLIFGAGCSKKSGNANTTAPEVLVAEVSRKDVPIVKEWVATLDGLVNATISARVSGHLISQDYKEGTAVKKGDLLFQIDPRPFEDALAQAKATLAKDEAARVKAEQDEKRAVDLFSKKVTSQQERDAAFQAAESSKGLSEADRAAVKDAELNLEYTKVTAPIDGIAGFVTAQVGDLVGPSTGPLTTISQVDPIKAIGTGSEQSYTEFATRYSDPEKQEQYLKRLEFELVLANGSIYPQKGKFYALDRNVNIQTGSIRFEATFPNPGNVLRPGQFARIRATTETRKGALLVPQEAVTELQGNYQVAVIGSDNKASIRPVKVGDRFGAMWEIKEGVEPGDKVVVQGIQKIREGAPVVAKRWMPPAETPTVAEADKPKNP
ncbi:MAG: efflux transporter periplasmic adaptor subunit [Verrucomicrobia bacterium]|nr:MAG: efflux transporter periplasmic adaptor subunit [Verrucomicrobiota bacterium]